MKPKTHTQKETKLNCEQLFKEKTTYTYNRITHFNLIDMEEEGRTWKKLSFSSALSITRCSFSKKYTKVLKTTFYQNTSEKHTLCNPGNTLFAE